MNIAAIRTALVAAISTIEGLNADFLRDNPLPPCAIVAPETPFPFDLTFDDMQKPMFRVLILVPYVDTQNSQEQLDAYLATDGAQSVKAAIEKDLTLGGVVNEVHVNDLRSYGVMSMRDGGTEYLSAELSVEVYA